MKAMAIALLKDKQITCIWKLEISGLMKPSHQDSLYQGATTCSDGKLIKIIPKFTQEKPISGSWSVSRSMSLVNGTLKLKTYCAKSVEIFTEKVRRVLRLQCQSSSHFFQQKIQAWFILCQLQEF